MRLSKVLRRALVRCLERRRDAAFARAIQWALGSLGYEENLWLAGVYDMLAEGLQR